MEVEEEEWVVEEEWVAEDVVVSEEEEGTNDMFSRIMRCEEQEEVVLFYEL